MNTQPRATKGGEIGPNGEWYNAGAFIATTEMSKKERAKKARDAKELARKVMVAPYTWECRPSLDVCAIYSSLGGVVADFRGSKPTAIKDACVFMNLDPKKVQAILDAYSAGERWIAVDWVNNCKS